jgi:hypothetical protein
MSDPCSECLKKYVGVTGYDLLELTGAVVSYIQAMQPCAISENTHNVVIVMIKAFFEDRVLVEEESCEEPPAAPPTPVMN